MKPNIFDLATKELSQDAFLTWLLSYADPQNAKYDSKIHLCAQQLISELINTQIQGFDDTVAVVNAGRQWNNIDVWVKVNNTYFIIIEDKTNTQHHSNQLKRYKELASNWCLENNYKPPICVYIKTGNESLKSLNTVREAGYSIYNRKHLLQLLNDHPEITNEIFIDFKERLIRIESDNNQFSNKIISQWNGTDWQGFFQYLESEMGISSWNYVNNPSGGFWSAILKWDSWGIYPVYIQLEEGKLCFKISTDVIMPPNISRAQVRNHLYGLLVKKAKDEDIKNIRRPNRFGSGIYMTAAIVDKENWLGANESIIDPIKVVENLNFLPKIPDKIGKLNHHIRHAKSGIGKAANTFRYLLL